MMKPMNTKRSLPLLAGLLLIAAILLGFIRYLSEHQDKPQGTTAPPVPSRSRPAQAISDEPGKHPEEQPGLIDLPEFGRIPYARHRTVRVAELINYLPCMKISNHELTNHHAFANICSRAYVQTHSPASLSRRSGHCKALE